MTAYATTRRVATALVLAALMVLAVAPAAMAQTAADGDFGWERSNVTTGRPDGGQLTQRSTVPDGPRGWEATGVTTGATSSTSSDDRPVTVTPQTQTISPTMLSILVLLAGAIVAYGTVRVVRPHRPHRVA